ncbi:hypothetical protein IMZ48_10620 [Candidatus Bathyarchaeota archaeon]|nr:hypothetical protein [Candidatus Bathyarchaeota archaeon]
MHNPRVSEEAKHSAEERLEHLGESGHGDSQEDRHLSHV